MTDRAKIELNTSDLNICLATLSLYICVYGLVSYVVKHRLYLSEPLIALLFGIIVGPAVLGWVNPNLWKPEEDMQMGHKDSLTLALTRITIGIQVFFAGVALPKKYLKTEFQSLVVLLLPIMCIAWLVCGFLIFKLIPNLTFMEALLISACITPTDPVLANSITKGRYAEESVSPAIRNIIVAESGANDGLGYPFVFLPLFAFLARSSGEFYAPNRQLSGVIARWIYETWLYQIAFSVALGFLIGWVARKSLRWCEERGMLDDDNFVAYGTGLSFFCLGFLGIISSDDILCSFVAGNSFSWDDKPHAVPQDKVKGPESRQIVSSSYDPERQVEIPDKLKAPSTHEAPNPESFQDIIDMLLNAAIFMYIGAIIPWSAYNDIATGITSWRIVALALCVMLFRRLPWVVGIYKLIPAISSMREAIFTGWLGPIGVSAVFYVQVALAYLPSDGREQVKMAVQPVVYFMVFTSVLVHGVTVPMTKAFVHGVTLTRTLTQTGETVQRNSKAPVLIGDIHRVGIPVPLATYQSQTSGRVSASVTPSLRPNSPELEAGLAISAKQSLDEGPRTRAPSPPLEGRTIMFKNPV